MSGAGNRIGVLVAEDNIDLCAAICELIGAEADLCVTASVQRAGELLEAARATAPHVVVLDLDLAGESSIPALQAFQAAQPLAAVVIYSGHDRALLGHAFTTLARCEYVTKNGDPTELLGAIRRVARQAAGAGG